MEINDNLFSTFVGDFTLDFGPAGAFFIFVIFYSSLIKLTRERKQQIKLYKLLLLYFALCISLQGGMTLFSYSDVSGNLRMLNCLLLYAYLRYHEQFSRAFPLQKNN
ncbi:conserved domain protein [Prevotella denticola CRIS 18C-A]|uniref:Conserved domain protein n=2 Tax=Prevotella denticola TaxID=28129 RepID=F0H4H5_9BACT|nr:conserved domain protein [Prevotella denticola CRIS 18C-A]